MACCTALRGAPAAPSVQKAAARPAAKRAAIQQAHIAENDVGLVVAQHSGIASEDEAEQRALGELFASTEHAPAALISGAGAIGHCGAAAGLLSVAQAVLCLERNAQP